MATKTVTLTGAEQRVDELGGLNTLIVNNTDAPLYASAKAGITPYADGVIEIKAGASRGLPDTNGTVYLLGNGGRAELTGTSASVNFNVPSSSSEGGGGITRDEVNEIVTDKIAEVIADAPEDLDTLKEISDWIAGHEDSAAAMNSAIKANAADISDIQTEQQTQNSDISTLQNNIEQKADISNVSNPNLLDNPDFKINQRGQSEYVNVTYTVDRWFMPTNGLKMEVYDDHIKVGRTDNRSGKVLRQYISRSELDLSGKTVTFSTEVSGVKEKDYISILSEDNNYLISAPTPTDGTYYCTVKIPDTYDTISVCYHTTGTTPHMIIPYWAKLEIGDKPTPFVPPNPALELLKCQRYYQRLKGMSSRFLNGRGVGYQTDKLDVILSLPVIMRETPILTFNSGIKSAIWDNTSESWGSTTKMITNIIIDQYHGNDIVLLFTTENLENSKNYFWQIESGYIELSADL